MAFFSKRYHPPGTAPGTLRELPHGLAAVRVVVYGQDRVEVADAQGAIPPVPTMADGVTWIHIQGPPSQRLLQQLGDDYGLHPLALEDIHNTGQRPKVEEFDDQIATTLSLPRFEDGRVAVYQVNLFFRAGLTISLCEGGMDPFEPVLQRIRTAPTRFHGYGADYLLYALIDSVIDLGFPVLEAFGQALDDLEDRILIRPGSEALPRIHAVKRELILLRRVLWPQRDVLHALVREERKALSPHTLLYLRDAYDHTVQVLDLLETYRDISASMLDIHLSSVSNRMNEVMRVLTVIATIFIPLTFLAGVYGMNFGEHSKSRWAMPELGWDYGYPVLLLVMGAIAGGMLVFFRRKHWL